jgi:(E)-4-hydroxy-3-methylbut-2-enyl-diphosphate synthase
MLYLAGIQKEKVLTDEIITRVVNEVEKKVSELKKN